MDSNIHIIKKNQGVKIIDCVSLLKNDNQEVSTTNIEKIINQTLKDIESNGLEVYEWTELEDSYRKYTYMFKYADIELRK